MIIVIVFDNNYDGHDHDDNDLIHPLASLPYMLVMRQRNQWWWLSWLFLIMILILTTIIMMTMATILMMMIQSKLYPLLLWGGGRGFFCPSIGKGNLVFLLNDHYWLEDQDHHDHHDGHGDHHDHGHQDQRDGDPYDLDNLVLLEYKPFHFRFLFVVVKSHALGLSNRHWKHYV